MGDDIKEARDIVVKAMEAAALDNRDDEARLLQRAEALLNGVLEQL